MTKAEVATLLQTLTVMYPASRIRADELTLGIWHEMLKDLPGEVVGMAVKRMCAVLKYPPAIADIREAVAKAAQEARGVLSAGEAWAKVKRAAGWYGSYRPDEARAALGEEIWRAVQMVGGWREICLGEGSETAMSAQFERRYSAMLKQEAERIQIPEGVRVEMERLVEAKLLSGGGADAG